MNYRILSSVGLAGMGVATLVLSIPGPKPIHRRIDWDKVKINLEEECGNGTRFEGKGREEPKNDKGLTQKGYEDCKSKVYNSQYRLK